MLEIRLRMFNLKVFCRTEESSTGTTRADFRETTIA